MMESRKRKVDELVTEEQEVLVEEADKTLPLLSSTEMKNGSSKEEQRTSSTSSTVEDSSSKSESNPAGLSGSTPSTTTATSSSSGSGGSGTVTAGTGFSAYAKINPFALATAGLKPSNAFGFNASSTPKEGANGGLRPNFVMPTPLTVPSPKSPKANPFSSPSPAHNPFMTIVESKDDLWQAMAKDKLSQEEAAKTSVFESSNKKARVSKFGYPPEAFAVPSVAPIVPLFESSSHKTDETAPTSAALIGGEEEDGGNEEEDGEGSPVEPVYTTYALPENVVVTTGEEAEDCLLQVRVKLFRLNVVKPKEGDEAGSSSQGLKSLLTLPPVSSTKDSEVDGGVSGLLNEQQGSLDTAEEREDPNVVVKSVLASQSVETRPAAEWVEVGIGPLKLLRPRPQPSAEVTPSDASINSDDKKAHALISRIVIRREEKKGGMGTKLLLNLRLDRYSSVLPQSDRCLRVQGVTFGEDATSSVGTFLIKLKAPDECNALLDLVREAKQT